MPMPQEVRTGSALPKSLPSFSEYRHKNSAVMIPDRGFKKQLKAIDSELDVVWDWGSEKWEIWKFPEDSTEPFHVTTVQTKKKSYKELSADVLLQLQRWHPSKVGAKELLAYLEETEEQVRRRKMREFKNKIEAIANETFDYVRGVVKLQVPRKYKIAEVVSNA